MFLKENYESLVQIIWDSNVDGRIKDSFSLILIILTPYNLINLSAVERCNTNSEKKSY